jgi:hypothetical protein
MSIPNTNPTESHMPITPLAGASQLAKTSEQTVKGKTGVHSVQANDTLSSSGSVKGVSNMLSSDLTTALSTLTLQSPNQALLNKIGEGNPLEGNIPQAGTLFYLSSLLAMLLTSSANTSEELGIDSANWNSEAALATINGALATYKSQMTTAHGEMTKGIFDIIGAVFTGAFGVFGAVGDAFSLADEVGNTADDGLGLEGAGDKEEGEGAKKTDEVGGFGEGGESSQTAENINQQQQEGQITGELAQDQSTQGKNAGKIEELDKSKANRNEGFSDSPGAGEAEEKPANPAGADDLKGVNAQEGTPSNSSEPSWFRKNLKFLSGGAKVVGMASGSLFSGAGAEISAHAQKRAAPDNRAASFYQALAQLVNSVSSQTQGSVSTMDQLSQTIMGLVNQAHQFQSQISQSARN